VYLQKMIGGISFGTSVPLESGVQYAEPCEEVERINDTICGHEKRHFHRQRVGHNSWCKILYKQQYYDSH